MSNIEKKKTLDKKLSKFRVLELGEVRKNFDLIDFVRSVPTSNQYLIEEIGVDTAEEVRLDRLAD